MRQGPVDECSINTKLSLNVHKFMGTSNHMASHTCKQSFALKLTVIF